MATLILSAGGQALGGFAGGPAGALIGRAAGAIAGSVLDRALLAPKARKVEGPRLDDLRIMASSEGAVVPRLWGRARLAGQVIWATNLEEVVSTRKEKAGGKGAAGAATKITEYSYFANFAVALCEGPVGRIGRMWADGKEIDASAFTWRFYPGSEDQEPDSLIIAKEGAEHAPAYRGTAYVVFERMALERFGNRLPQLAFEVFRALDDVEGLISGVNIIPGTTEFGYEPAPVTRSGGWGATEPENVHLAGGRSDWTQSLDQLVATAPSLKAASLVVAWFGDDLRAGECRLKPGVELAEKSTAPKTWKVAGLARNEAHLVSSADGRPAFGGTPSDEAVVAAIADLRERGLKPVFYPFIMMDVPAGNTLPDPYTGAVGQPVYPWRGRITCDPAPGVAGSPDKSAAVLPQVQAFFGEASPADFGVVEGEVVYSGPEDWGLRRMVLHYAHLCALAGGVEAFLIGSELRGLTWLRDGPASHPAVEALRTLAADVAAVLPGAKISYAADWSEYFGHQPQDGSGDVFFHLDPLWADESVHFIGLDNYMPLSDWRDGSAHLDAEAGVKSIYDLDYLRGNVAGGEGYDWFYASAADRAAQVRTPITDGAYGRPWVFRYKDVKSWWSSEHFNRPGGVESATPTAWVPQSKPVWFTEAGCPAVDKGSNQPNVFFDPRSSESALPYHSAGVRDDFIQRRYVEALCHYWREETEGNPTSSLYGGRMVDPDRIIFWCWDARPFPAFPALTEVWADGGNYELGHWLNGRLGAVPLAALVESIAGTYGFSEVDAAALLGAVDGFLVERISSAREAIEPLGELFAFDAVESGGLIRFRHRFAGDAMAVDAEGLVEEDPERPLFTLQRAQETELPTAIKLGYVEAAEDYRHAAVEARRLAGSSLRERVLEVPCVMSQAAVLPRAEIMLHEAWVGREAASFTLPPSALGVEPGDHLLIAHAGRELRLRVEEVSEASARRVRARLIEPSVYEPAAAPARTATLAVPPAFGPARHLVLDLPMLTDEDSPHAPWIALSARPWPGSLAVYSDEGGSLALNRIVRAPAIMGETLDDLPAGPEWRFDRAHRLKVTLFLGALSSVSEAELLAGANAAAVGDEASGFEVIQFRDATLVAPQTYELSVLLRGQAGSDPEMRALLPAGAMFVVLDGAVRQLDLGADDVGRPLTLRAGPLGRDIGDPSYAEFDHTPSGLASRPLSPVRLKARRQGGDIRLTWIRRTRVRGDNWNMAEVPLAEEAELYRLEILDGAEAVRTVETASASYTYTAAEQAADFGGPLSAVGFRVTQVSAAYGPGASREAHSSV